MAIRIYAISADDPTESARHALTDWRAHPDDTIYVDGQGWYAVAGALVCLSFVRWDIISPEELEALLKENEMQACPHGVVSGPCTCCLPEEFAQEERIEEGARARICPDCNGSALSPYPTDGGSCPHCFGGLLN